MKTLICFGEDWGRHPSTLHFLAQRLAKDYRIIWIESLGMRRPKLTLADAGRIVTKLRNWLSGASRGERLSGNLTVYSPLVLPFHGSQWARSINVVIIQRALKRLLRRYGNGLPPVVVTDNPVTEYFIGRLGEAMSVYYCADEYAQMPGVDPVLVSKLEARLLQKVDAVVVTSESLFGAKSKAGKPTWVLRHGVDFEHFSTAALPDTPVASMLSGIRRPIFGYHGLVQGIIDFNLVASVAQERPHWSFVFIGPLRSDAGKVPSAPNIHYLGAHLYEHMPSIIKGFDVCLIPYKVDERTWNCNPIKLREYLAAGKPVISTPLPEVLVFDDVVTFASTFDEFVVCGEKLLRETGPAFAEKRMARVKGDSWEAIAQRFGQVLESPAIKPAQ